MADCILGHKFHDEMVSKIRRLEKENEKLQANTRELVIFLKDMEQWEADMLTDDEVWGTTLFPKWNRKTYDGYMELQAKRNELLEKVKGIGE